MSSEHKYQVKTSYDLRPYTRLSKSHWLCGSAYYSPLRSRQNLADRTKARATEQEPEPPSQSHRARATEPEPPSQSHRARATEPEPKLEPEPLLGTSFTVTKSQAGPIRRGPQLSHDHLRLVRHIPLLISYLRCDPDRTSRGLKLG
ncbi:hypothetical protein PtrM4_144500 [Pyrenophora tritici-repentis]|uniref:Uncharacterized protein n=1 Tax=Pyrenophora tritici-repentis TaxID=45151 RepID=A0A834RMH0_9PLEO|nr:hypothetical protein PtrM4_144500 [Pyrenophora tritici-repentis]